MTTLIDLEQPTLDLPADLREKTSERALIALTLAAAETVAARLPRWSEVSEAGSNRKMLLALLTYHYAAGIYGSEDIEWNCSHDAAARHLCGPACPEADTLRHFRRANHSRIEECLASVYGEACEANFRGTVPERGGIGEFQQEPSTDILSLVRRKLDLAILIDTAMSE